MNTKQRFKPGDHVITPSVSALNKQSGTNEDKYVHSTIVFAHPNFGWCTFKYDNSSVTASAYNENIFFEDEYKERLEQLAKQAEEERERREREENGEYDDFESENSDSGDPLDDEDEDFDEIEEFAEIEEDEDIDVDEDEDEDN